MVLISIGAGFIVCSVMEVGAPIDNHRIPLFCESPHNSLRGALKQASNKEDVAIAWRNYSLLSRGVPLVFTQLEGVLACGLLFPFLFLLHLYILQRISLASC